MQAADRSGIANRGEPSGGFRPHTPVQTLFLARLRDLLAKREQYGGQLSADDWRMRLLDKALYSTYRDCVSLGIGDEARAILKLRQSPRSQAS